MFSEHLCSCCTYALLYTSKYRTLIGILFRKYFTCILLYSWSFTGGYFVQKPLMNGPFSWMIQRSRRPGWTEPD
ncbi:hypothetical protein BDN70DRAFT_329420 [Pholiota conissans]|uniref:Uncharacterized protein n=1 Tax=Pholiota conissans TaxID=109636 RepID=A0A9P5YSB0_9AGAR|nr:hypothetical protein BDN70DRAFT_329420 [Pholiota conissans]